MPCHRVQQPGRAHVVRGETVAGETGKGMGKRLGVALALLSLGLGSCAEPQLRPARAKRPAVPAEAFETAGLIAKPGRCGATDTGDNKGIGFDDVLDNFAPPFANILGNFVTSSITAALEYRQQARNAVWHASTTLPFDAAALADAEAICLRLFRGAISDAQGPRWSGEPVFDADIELEWREADDTLMLAARPVRLAYADTSAAARSGKHKHVTVLLAFSKAALPHGVPDGDEGSDRGDAGSPETRNSVALVRIDIGRLEIGKSYDRRLLGLVSGGAVLPDDTIPRRRTAQPRVVADLLDGMTLTGVVFESDGRDPALEAFLAAWQDNQPAVVTALSDTLEAAAKGEGD